MRAISFVTAAVATAAAVSPIVGVASASAQAVPRANCEAILKAAIDFNHRATQANTAGRNTQAAVYNHAVANSWLPNAAKACTAPKAKELITKAINDSQLAQKANGATRTDKAGALGHEEAVDHALKEALAASGGKA